MKLIEKLKSFFAPRVTGQPEEDISTWQASVYVDIKTGKLKWNKSRKLKS